MRSQEACLHEACRYLSQSALVKQLFVYMLNCMNTDISTTAVSHYMTRLRYNNATVIGASNCVMSYDNVITM